MAAVSSSAFILPGFKRADAGVFSFISDVLGNKETSANSASSKYNSQTLAILEAPLSSKFAVGGGDIAIVDSNALEYQAESSDTTQSDQISAYVVREGDTLSAIAKMFNVSVNTILWANDIKNNTITPGQNLVILPVSGIRHVVVSGDTVQSIVKKHNGDLEEVLGFNNLSADSKLAVGEVVIIPNGDATPVTKSGSTVTPKASAGKNLAGYFTSPIPSGYRKTQGIHGYNGVDLAAPLGTNVVASASGKVIVSKNSGYNGGYGNYVVISHPNGTQTLYGHLNETLVVQGQNVSQGQLIGYLGSTGRSTGPHVHFEVRGAKNPF